MGVLDGVFDSFGGGGNKAANEELRQSGEDAIAEAKLNAEQTTKIKEQITKYQTKASLEIMVNDVLKGLLDKIRA